MLLNYLVIVKTYSWITTISYHRQKCLMVIFFGCCRLVNENYYREQNILQLNDGILERGVEDLTTWLRDAINYCYINKGKRVTFSYHEDNDEKLIRDFKYDNNVAKEKPFFCILRFVFSQLFFLIVLVFQVVVLPNQM